MSALRSTAWPRAQRRQQALLALVAALLLVSGPAAFWPTRPPSQAALNARWMRPADGMNMVYVPAGEFTMGLNDQDLRYVLDLCQVYNPG